MEQKIGKKIFHICMVIVIIVAILFAVGVIILRYQVEGETNLPFQMTDIKIISSVDATDNEDATNRWNLTVHQNNDIYITIAKNEDYNKTEVIQDVVLNNFTVTKENELGTTQIYIPATEENIMFKNAEENATQEVIYTGDLETNIKDLKISNQGGMIAFRYANNDVSTYISNEGEEIDYSTLLKATNISEEDLKATLQFDLTINLTSGKSYKTNITLEMPIEGVVEAGTTSRELTDLSSFVFKRIENN